MTKIAAEKAQLIRDFEDERQQSLRVVDEVTRARDAARAEVSTQAEVCEALNTRVKELVTQAETLRTEMGQIQASLVAEHNTVLAWRQKCEGMCLSLGMFFLLSSDLVTELPLIVVDRGGEGSVRGRG